MRFRGLAGSLAATVLILAQWGALADTHVNRFADSGWLSIGCNDRTTDAWLRKVAFYDREIASYPGDSGPYVDRALAHLCADQNADAVADYGRALAISPNSKRALMGRGLAKERVRDMAGAIADFTSFIALDPRNAEAYLNRALAYAAAADVKSALRDFATALAIDSDYVDAYNDRATVYADNGDLASAMADYDEAVRRNPDDLNTRINRGARFIRLGRTAQAIADFDKVLKAKPDDPVAHLDRCSARATAGIELDKALADCDADLQLRPGHPATLNTRADVLMQLGLYDEAIASLDAAVIADPHDWSNLEARCRARAVSARRREVP
jgi:tetratricopeptide (TPR) repeat protein